MSALAGIEHRIAGLEGGADDYLIKPFAFAERVARLGVLARHPPLGDQLPEPPIFKVGTIEMDMVRRTVDLQTREFSLLEYMLRHPDQFVTRTMLLDRVWNFGFDPRTNIVETHMSQLQAKLNAHGKRDPIRTVRGSGYMMSSNTG